jgi:hypothetical protein
MLRSLLRQPREVHWPAPTHGLLATVAARQVNEEDMMFGLWRKRCTSEITRASLSLIQVALPSQAPVSDQNFK